jgi:hypothetical protein
MGLVYPNKRLFLASHFNSMNIAWEDVTILVTSTVTVNVDYQYLNNTLWLNVSIFSSRI